MGLTRGYSYVLSGKIIGRSAPRSELPEQFGPGEDWGDDDRDIYAQIEGEEDSVGIIDGRVTVVEGERYVVIQPSTTGSVSNGKVDARIQEMATWLHQQGTTDFEGAIYIVGDDTLDMTRVRVDGFKPSGTAIVAVERPEIVWPNGDKGLPTNG